MDEPELFGRIEELVDSVHRVRLLQQGRPRDPEAIATLGELETALDRCWQEVRWQRAHRAEAGKGAGRPAAQVRV